MEQVLSFDDLQIAQDTELPELTQDEAHLPTASLYQPQTTSFRGMSEHQQALPVGSPFTSRPEHAFTSASHVLSFATDMPTTHHLSSFSSDEDEPSILALMYIEVQIKPSLAARGRKQAKATSTRFGPVEIPTDLTWDCFLDIIAQSIKTKIEYIDISSIAFRPPRSQASASSYNPVTSELGLRAMINTLKEKTKSKTPPTFYIKLAQPAPSLPWETHAETPASGKRAIKKEGLVGEDEKDIMGPIQKRGKYDMESAEIEEQIIARLNKMPCQQYPKRRCIVNPATDDHFDVNEPRLTIWALKIASGEATVEMPPFGHAMWTKANAIRKADTPPPLASSSPSPATAPAQAVSTTATAAAAAATATTTGSACQTFPMPSFGFHPMMSMIANPTMFNPYAFPPPSFQFPVPLASTSAAAATATATATANPKYDIRSSSPVIPDDIISIEEFCNRYHLDSSIAKRLEELQFVPGDRLSQLPQEEWEAVGFKQLSWNRVVSANKKYRNSLCNNNS
ncbi:hypothetical protein A7U60_g3917 [Sanghuangporus baumii]|uniref:Uncharacterized protein n=1 Tax=Sanghuangporus baumii TaxID=108892 RepID=A0A9Q5HZL4_SANBA|nr:hypothetical protein A7U60_g3917 [Sanghuangporus baumii]